MKRPYQILGIFLVLFAAFVLRESLQLDFWSTLGPGPGFFPTWMAIILGLLGAGIFLQVTLGRSDPRPPDFVAPAAGYFRMAAILLAMVFVVVGMEFLGFRLTMFAFLFFILFFLERRNPLTIALVALVSSLGMYYFFAWLATPLPIGVLGF